MSERGRWRDTLVRMLQEGLSRDRTLELNPEWCTGGRQSRKKVCGRGLKEFQVEWQ